MSQVNKNAEISKEALGSPEDKRDSFRCDKCGSPFIVNPMVRGNKVKKSELGPSPRHKVDPKTKKILSLCNACGKFELVHFLLLQQPWVPIYHPSSETTHD